MRRTWPSVTGLAARANRQVGSSLRMVQGVISKSRMIIARSSQRLLGLLFFCLAGSFVRPKRRSEGRPRPLHRDAGGLDDRTPFGDLGRDVVAQLHGRAAHRLHIKRLELLLPERALEI